MLHIVRWMCAGGEDEQDKTTMRQKRNTFESVCAKGQRHLSTYHHSRHDACSQAQKQFISTKDLIIGTFPLWASRQRSEDVLKTELVDRRPFIGGLRHVHSSTQGEDTPQIGLRYNQTPDFCMAMSREKRKCLRESSGTEESN